MTVRAGILMATTEVEASMYPWPGGLRPKHDLQSSQINSEVGQKAPDAMQNGWRASLSVGVCTLSKFAPTMVSLNVSGL